MLWNHVGVRGVTMDLMLWALDLNFSSGDLTNTSSHICGNWYLPIFLFREGSFILINIASLMVLAMLWSSLPTSCSETLHDQWCCDDHGWLVEPLCILWTSVQKFCLIPQCILHQSPPCHTWTDRSLHSFAGWYLCLWDVPGGPWWCCLLWKTFLPHFFCRCFCSSDPCLVCMGQLYVACC